MSIFHTHKYDPSAWKLEKESETFDSFADYFYFSGGAKPQSTGVVRLYSNTCLKCGDISFRTVAI